MYIEKILKSGVRAEIMISFDTEARLKGTCFRGTKLARAGNFSKWNSSQELFSDEEILEHFLDELEELLMDHRHRTSGVTITHSDVVGWESTTPLGDCRGDELEEFEPNRRSLALRMKASCTDRYAPQTKNLTIVLEVRSNGKSVLASVHSIYPGEGIGELKGNITLREKRVFFDWNHPGAT